MVTSTSSKHFVRVEKPAGKTLSIAYSTLKEAQHQAIALERDGYKILEIGSTSLPKPNL
jgi:hypothetical protein